VPDLRKQHLKMLLYRSRQHFDVHKILGCHSERQVALETGAINIPRGIWAESMNIKPGMFSLSVEFLNWANVLPEIIDSYDFTAKRLDEIRQEYTLYESEKDDNQCPFCRVNHKTHLMQVLSSNFPQCGIEKGGVSTYCIHLMFDENYEPLDFLEYKRVLKTEGQNFDW
jgi:hypothetical protein